MQLKYSYLACGPRVKCSSCGVTEWSEVKQRGESEAAPLSWSLHCGGACSQKALTTGIFSSIENPLMPNLTANNKKRFEENRKQALSWLLGGWLETERRVRANNLLYVSTGSLKEFAQLVLEVVGKKSKLLGEPEKPTDDAIKESHNKHLAKLKRQFPELFESATFARQPNGTAVQKS